MRAKPTPGPWKLILDDPEQRFEIHHESPDSEPGCIAHVFAADADDMYSEAMANARLIAAAPELLAVLESLADDLVRYSKMTEEVWSSGSIALGAMADSAIAAITKATGQEVGHE